MAPENVMGTIMGIEPLDSCFGGGVPASTNRDVLPPFPSTPITSGGFARGKFYPLYVTPSSSLSSIVFMLGQTAYTVTIHIGMAVAELPNATRVGVVGV